MLRRHYRILYMITLYTVKFTNKGALFSKQSNYQHLAIKRKSKRSRRQLSCNIIDTIYPTYSCRLTRGSIQCCSHTWCTASVLGLGITLYTGICSTACLVSSFEGMPNLYFLSEALNISTGWYVSHEVGTARVYTLTRSVQTGVHVPLTKHVALYLNGYSCGS